MQENEAQRYTEISIPINNNRAMELAVIGLAGLGQNVRIETRENPKEPYVERYLVMRVPVGFIDEVTVLNERVFLTTDEH